MSVDALSAVMPARNEEQGIETAVRQALEALDRCVAEFELIVIDDCSTDRTGALLDALARAEPRLRVIHLVDDEGGYGWALRAGFRAARHPWVFFTDSDMQFDIGELTRLIPLAAHADIVVGYRLRRAEGSLRHLISRGYNRLVRTLWTVRARDVNCAFKLMRRRLLESIELESRRYCVNVELLVLADRMGARLREVGVSHFRRAHDQSKVGPLDVVRATVDLAKLEARFVAPRRPHTGRASSRSHG